MLLDSTIAQTGTGQPPQVQVHNRTARVLNAEQTKAVVAGLTSSNRSQVLSSLDSLRHVQPNPELTTHVQSLAEKSRDSIIQGYARLLAADWGIQLNQPPVHSKLSDKKEIPVGSPTKQPQSPTFKFADNPNLRALPNVALQQQNRAAIGYSLNDSSTGNSIFANNASHQLSDNQLTPENIGFFSELEPQVPFWLDNASTAKSLPADVEDFGNLPAPAEQNSTHFQFTDQPRGNNAIRPGILDRPIDAQPDSVPEPKIVTDGIRNIGGASGTSYFAYDLDAPLGYTGPSGVVRTEFQHSDHFVPIEDRWRLGFPKWDRYGKGHPILDDYPFKEGNILDPFNQNVLKGDYPLIGQHIFYTFTAELLAVHEFRQTPTATTPFESTNDPFSAGFFGDHDQLFYTPFFKFSFDLFHGNEAFKPVDWRFRLTPVFNVNYLEVGELAVVNPDVRNGTDRLKDHASIEEWFVEAKLADIGPDYDFISTRIGSQFFVSDFRGFVFRDFNRAVRLFGTRLSNRDQFNALWFDQAEKNTNSELNSFEDRHQNVVILNYFRQDFIYPGYMVTASFHYNKDQPSFKFDDNDVLVRPDPVGVFKPHQVDAYYLGLGGTGHIKRVNVLNQFYLVLGEDSTNPIAGREQTINAFMGALELSYDRDWIRFRGSYFYASGDNDPNDGRATGFDTILDDPIFAGGEFSYWQRQAIRLFGTNLTQRKSIVPNLRSSKIQGQSNFVNPGLHLFNIGTDVEITPKTRMITNANYLFFDHTEVLETYTFQNKINREIGFDLSTGIEYRPLLNDNAIIVAGVATLIPSQGLKDLFGAELPEELANIGVGDELRDENPRLTSAFVEVVLTY